MSFFAGYSFFAYFFCAVIPAAILGIKEWFLRYYRMFLTLLFVVLAYGDEPVQMLYLLIYVCGSCALVKWYLQNRTVHGRKGKLYGCAVAAALLPLMISKARRSMWENYI